jgi:hypothetical protein
MLLRLLWQSGLGLSWGDPGTVRYPSAWPRSGADRFIDNLWCHAEDAKKRRGRSAYACPDSKLVREAVDVPRDRVLRRRPR